MLRTGLLVTVFALVAGVAAAQSSMNRSSAIHGQWKNQARIAVAVNMFVEAPTDSSPQAIKAQEDARRTIYEIAAGECTLLLKVIAEDCRLENVNVNINRHHRPQQPDGFTVRGNMGFRVTLK